MIALVQRLREDSEDKDVIQEIEAIKGWGTARVRLNGGNDRKSPDAGWQPRSGSDYPTIVCEHAFTQSEEALKQKAQDWVHRTNGGVRWVLGFKLEYPTKSETLQGWLWLWQAVQRPDGSYHLHAVDNLNRQVLYSISYYCHSLIFSPKQFIPENPERSTLELKLRYFLAPTSTIPAHIQNRVISIPLLDLPEAIATEIEAETRREALNRVAKEGAADASLPAASP